MERAEPPSLAQGAACDMESATAGVPLHDHAPLEALVRFAQPAVRRKHEQDKTPKSPTPRAPSALASENVAKWTEADRRNHARRNFEAERKARGNRFSQCGPVVSTREPSSFSLRAQQRQETVRARAVEVYAHFEERRVQQQQCEWDVASPCIGRALESAMAPSPFGRPKPPGDRDSFPAMVWAQHEQDARAARRGVNAVLREAAWVEQAGRAAAALREHERGRGPRQGGGCATGDGDGPQVVMASAPAPRPKPESCLCDLLRETCPRCAAEPAVSRWWGTESAPIQDDGGRRATPADRTDQLVFWSSR